MITLPYDIQVSREKDSDGPLITWSFNVDGIGPFIRQRAEDANNCAWENLDGYDNLKFSWMPGWSIKTPKGYSTLFTHPINSPNLPFQTLTAVVDTDKHPLVINFPFFIRENFYGHIPAGTPIIQMIPFKRNDWEMEVIDNKVPPNYDRQWEVMGNAPMAWYKRKWWTKKSYT
jgi:hypothetical protein